MQGPLQYNKGTMSAGEAERARLLRKWLACLGVASWRAQGWTWGAWLREKDNGDCRYCRLCKGDTHWLLPHIHNITRVFCGRRKRWRGSTLMATTQKTNNHQKRAEVILIVHLGSQVFYSCSRLITVDGRQSKRVEVKEATQSSADNAYDRSEANHTYLDNSHKAGAVSGVFIVSPASGPQCCSCSTVSTANPSMLQVIWSFIPNILHMYLNYVR